MKYLNRETWWGSELQSQPAPQVMTALGIVCCYIMGRSLAWNWLSLVSCVFLVLFTFGLYYIPESPPWLVYNEEEDLAFKSMAMTRSMIFLLIEVFVTFHLPMTTIAYYCCYRGEEYDATQEIEKVKVWLGLV